MKTGDPIPSVELKSQTIGSKPARLTSLDAFRGLIILMMASGGFALTQIAEKHYPDYAWLHWLGYHAEHAAWQGCTLWDLIQPAFMFMVGVALPWSVANRTARGDGFFSMFKHALWRAVILILISVFLSSYWEKQTDWSFNNVLAQIGLGYPFLFMLAFTDRRGPWIAALGILLLYWLAFAVYPLPPVDFDYASVGQKADWPLLAGFEAHWNKSTNLAADFDVWFLNLFPRAKEYVFNSGGYQTLNFIPSLATMIFGLIVGRWLRSEISMKDKLLRLVIAGVSAIALGWLLDVTGVCPIVKRIWTPSFAIYSTGWVVLMLAGFMAVIDGAGYRRWAFPLIVAGLNPITIYCLWQLSAGFFKQQLKTHLGQDLFQWFGPEWVPAMERAWILLVLWLIAWLMYRKKIFVRI